MKKMILFVFLCLTCVTLINCASLFSDKIKNIPVTTNPENATISVYTASGGKIFEGKSPCVISFDKKQLVNGKVIVSQKGYKNSEIYLGNTIEPWAIANGCCLLMPGFILGGGFDFLTGNLNKPEVEAINIILDPVSDSKITSDITTIESPAVNIKIYENNGEYTLFISQN